MAILIGLTGRRGAGKDTAFQFISEWASERGLSAHRRGFADSLKLSFARMFIPDISLEEAVNWCDELKRDWEPGGAYRPAQLTVRWGRVDSHSTLTEIKHQISGRQALQRYGTEGHRDVFGDDFWVDALLPTDMLPPAGGSTEGTIGDMLNQPSWPMNFRGPLQAEAPDICVVTDTRFDNEARRINDLGGAVWEIDRGKTDIDGHRSEDGIMGELVDLVIDNHGDLDQLRDGVRAALDD